MNLFLVHLDSVLQRASTPANEKMYVDDLSYITVREDITDPRGGVKSSHQSALVQSETRFHSPQHLSVYAIETAANLVNESEKQNSSTVWLLLTR